MATSPKMGGLQNVYTRMGLEAASGMDVVILLRGDRYAESFYGYDVIHAKIDVHNRRLLALLQQRLHLIHIQLHGLLFAGALKLGPSVIFGAAHHVHHAWALTSSVTDTALLEVSIKKQHIVVAGPAGQGFHVNLCLLKGLLGHGVLLFVEAAMLPRKSLRESRQECRSYMRSGWESLAGFFAGIPR